MADIQGIYNQLNSGSQYTPLSAETFGDWSMEAGDMVTVVKDGRSYVTPIMQGDLKWDGASKVTIESVGNREREPLGRMSRRKYSGGGGGYWNSKKAFTKIEQNDEEIRLEAYKRENETTELRSSISVQAGLIQLETEQRQSDVAGLQSSITVQANRIGLVVEGTGANAKIKPASIVAAINNGESSVKIAADHIVLDGDAVATSLESKDLWVNALNAQNIESTEDISCLGDLTVAGDLQVSGNQMTVADITVSGNTMTISYADGRSDVTFSRATTLSGAWSSTYGPYRVTASPQGTTHDVHVEFVANGPSGFPIVRPSSSGANLFVISLDVGSVTGSGASASRTVSAKAGNNVAASQVITDYGDGYSAGRSSVTTIRPTAINVYTSSQGTVLDTRLSASILTSGKYITLKVGSTTYSIPIT